jgi:hypothetical protein
MFYTCAGEIEISTSRQIKSGFGRTHLNTIFPEVAIRTEHYRTLTITRRPKVRSMGAHAEVG